MKVLAITNLFPLPWEPNRAAFNRQQFEFLSGKCQVGVLVVVPWHRYLRRIGQVRSFTHGKMPVELACFFYIPKLGRMFYPALLLPSLLLKYFRLRKNKPDCLLLSWAYPDAVAGMILARLLRIPALIKVHGSDINQHCDHPTWAAQVVWAMKRAGAVLSVSRDLAGKLIELGVPENKIKVIYNGVDRNTFFPVSRSAARDRLNLPAEKKILLFVGNLRREKGCLDLLGAFGTLAGVDPDVDLHYIGPGGLALEMESIARQRGLLDRVHFQGAVDHAEIATWINASNALCLPSHNEGVPNVLLEAMACGVPVVATKVGGVPEIVPERAGLIVPPGDISALAGALGRVLLQERDRETIVAAVENFTWENNAMELYQLLKSITSLCKQS